MNVLYALGSQQSLSLKIFGLSPGTDSFQPPVISISHFGQLCKVQASFLKIRVGDETQEVGTSDMSLLEEIVKFQREPIMPGEVCKAGRIRRLRLRSRLGLNSILIRLNSSVKAKHFGETSKVEREAGGI